MSAGWANGRDAGAHHDQPGGVLHIQLLGPLRVSEAGHSLAIGGRQQRAVLALLALNANRVVTVDELLAGIWGDRATDGSVNVIQVYMSRLRRLGTDGVPIHRQPRGYLLEADAGSLDLLAFRELVDRARRIRSVSAARAAETLRAALHLWSSAPLQEFTGLPFAAAESAGLGRERQAALSSRIAVDLSLGRSAEVIPELETLTDQNPLAEDLHAQLALAYYRSGRQADTLAVIRRIRTRLADELGVDPGRGLQDLERAVLAHDPALAGERAATSGPTAPDADPDSTRRPSGDADDDPGWATEPAPTHRVWHAPARNPHFTGREALLDKLFHRLQGQPDTVAVETIYGLGGVGKTHLAIEYAHRFAGSYSVIWWINAEEPTFIPSQLARLNAELGLPPRASADDLVAQVLGHLGGAGGWLLIFDNAARVGDVAPYRPFGSGHILVTSRNPLWGEIGVRTPIDVLDRTESLAFLKSRMPDLDGRIGERLAAELGDLPLAMAQAVAYLEATAIDPAEYLDQFSRRRSAFLARGDVLDYQGRLDTAWDMSLQRLAATCPPALTLLELSAFLAPEPIPLELFTGPDVLVTDPDAGPVDPLDAVETAVGGAASLSLVRRQSASFQVHRLVQAVIRAHLTDAERTQVAARTATLLAGVLTGDPNDPSSWSTYRRLAPHVFALGTLAERLPQARQLLLDTTVYLGGAAPPRWSSDLARRVLDHWRVALGDDHPDTLAISTFVVHSSIWACAPRVACELGIKSLPVARRVMGADHPLTLRLAGYLSIALTEVADVDAAKELAFDTIVRARAAFPAEHPDLLRIYAYVPLALAWIGDPAATDLAEATFASARRVFGPDHPVTLLAAIETIFGLLTAGDTDAIRTLGEDTVARSRAVLGDRHLITLGSAALLALGLVWHGDVSRADELRRDLLSVADPDMAPGHVITLTIAAATASIRAADPRAADHPPDAELDIARQMPGPDHPITLALAAAAARLARRAGQPAEPLDVETAARARRQLGGAHPLARIPVPVGRPAGPRSQPVPVVIPAVSR
jgi:DNA-binding SARP family transcriptional activator